MPGEKNTGSKVPKQHIQAICLREVSASVTNIRVAGSARPRTRTRRALRTRTSHGAHAARGKGAEIGGAGKGLSLQKVRGLTDAAMAARQGSAEGEGAPSLQEVGAADREVQGNGPAGAGSYIN